jgi:hypothetical protein
MLPSVGGILRYSLECAEGFFSEFALGVYGCHHVAHNFACPQGKGQLRLRCSTESKRTTGCSALLPRNAAQPLLSYDGPEEKEVRL